MKKKIKALIEQYQTIIIHRHSRPDMDAIGSQVGLATVLKDNYPTKHIYVVGDLNEMSYLAKMDEIDDQTYQNALAIIVDVAVVPLISDHRYMLAKERIVIDHHQNPTDVKEAIFYSKPSYTSACEIIIDLVKTWKLKISSEAATYLYGGMVTDTGRFLYLNEKSAPHAFAMASYITKFKPNIAHFYEYLYTESLEKKQVKQLFSEFETTPNGLAYRKNDHELVLKSRLNIQSVSRGMVNLMSGIKEITVWASFTEDRENQKILGEFRARGISIVDIAKKYGGGGHAQACGASLKNWEEVALVIQDLDERAKENGKNIK